MPAKVKDEIAYLERRQTQALDEEQRLAIAGDALGYARAKKVTRLWGLRWKLAVGLRRFEDVPDPLTEPSQYEFAARLASTHRDLSNLEYELDDPVRTPRPRKVTEAARLAMAYYRKHGGTRRSS